VPYVPPPPRAPPRRRERPSALHREDAHARGGRLLLEAAAAAAAADGAPASASSAAAAAALDRLVAVVRCALALLEEARRPSADLLDTPVATLAYHRVAWREVGVGGGGGDGNGNHKPSRLLVCAQEVCSFDPDAAPEDEHAVPPPMEEEDDSSSATRRLAAAHWRAAPAAAVVAPPSAARRLLAGGGGGGEASEGPAPASLRVGLRGTSEAWLRFGGGESGGGDGEDGEEEEEERHTIELPALHLSDPLSHECALTLTGTLRVRCDASGLEARLELAKDGRVKGGALRASPAVAAALRRPGGGGGGDGGAEGKGLASEPMVQVGVFKGRWDEGGEVVVECAWLKPLAALAATVAAGAAAASAAPLITLPVWRSRSIGSNSQHPRPLAPLRSIDLRALPPMQLGRLWSAVADAAAYPSTVGAGAAAARLAAALSKRVGGLTLGRPAPRDVGKAAGGVNGKEQQAEQEQDGDAELEAFDREADRAAGGRSGAGAGGGGKEGEGEEGAAPHNVASCYHAEHVAGRRLAWQLRHELLRQGGG
jgi:hypothetical protein